MDAFHADSAAINRVGTRAIMDHFLLTRQSVAYWRRKGVPRTCRKPLVLFAESNGCDMADFRARYAADFTNAG